MNGQLFENFREIFLHRLGGVLELRKRVRPFRAAPFSAPAERGTRTAAGVFALTGRLLSLHRLSGALELPLAGSPLTGGEFFAAIQRGDSPSADGGDVAAPAAGAKRKGHLRFPFLFELLPFPCWDSLGADGRLRKQEKDAAVGLLLRLFRKIFAVHRQRTATHTVYSTQARHTRAAQTVCECKSAITAGFG